MISRTQIRENAMRFSERWKDETNERAESQTFWNEFLAIFGIDRKKIAWYEHTVKFSKTDRGYIDVFWPGKLICEQKSADKDLDAAFDQVLRYVDTLSLNERPIAAIVCDFKRMRIYNPGEEQEVREFLLTELVDNLHLFHFLEDEATGINWDAEELEASVKASSRLSELHDLLGAAGYTGHRLEVFLVRLLFCFFAEDSGIFDRKEFTRYVRDHSEINGAGVGAVISQVFEVLNTPEGERMRSIDADLRKFPYVNGGIFAESFPMPQFDATMTLKFYECADLDWSRISPSIFGSIFQGVMDDKQRRAEGAHYTTEENILKLAEPLFLDAVKRDLQEAGYSRKKLEALQDRISRLTFFDPACGCGNFLTVTYKQLRHVEDLILERLFDGQMVTDIGALVKVNVGQFYGIELLDFPCQIANVSLWLADHQANRRTGALFGKEYVRLPLVDYGQIVQGNALQMDWSEVIEPERCSYVLGNPPFIGARNQTQEQKNDIIRVFKGAKNSGNIDYVAGWYRLAADYIQGTSIRCAFVSTNSICQGEQVANIWKPIFDEGVRIDFAHKTFRWTSEARGTAHVFCIIVGFSLVGSSDKWLFEYATPDSEPVRTQAQNINAYLADAPDIFIFNRTKPIGDVPLMGIGSQPIDDGNYLFTDQEKNGFLRREPEAARFFHPWLGSKEFLNGYTRWCLWLGNATKQDLANLPECRKRVEAVREYRLKSKRRQTIEAASRPTHFGTEIIATTSSVIVPEVSSERRRYVPIGFVGPDTFCSNKVRLVPNATLYHLGVLSSLIHNAWMRVVSGRLKSDYSYSAGVVYNNFPWPNPTVEQKATIEALAQSILGVRAGYPDLTLADLYDPDFMPDDLRAAHKKLDRAVERAYGVNFGGNEDEIVSHLFKLHAALVDGV